MDPEREAAKKLAKRMILIIMGGFLVPVITVVLLSQLAVDSMGESGKNSPGMTPEEVAQRLKPVGEVTIATGPSAEKQEKTGEEVVKEVCGACHTAGVLNAPKIGDKKAWTERFKIGEAALLKHDIDGIRQMPPRGGNPALSDREVQAALEYMARQSGVKIKEQAPPLAAAAAMGSTGKTVFETTCAVCHVPGAANAPKFGDKAAWKPRIKTGIENLYNSAIHGKNAMPPKGGNPALSDADVKAAVDYMVSQSK